MQPLIRAATASGVAAVLVVRASREVSSRQPHTGAQLARRDRVPLEDFGATPGDVGPPSDLVAQADGSELGTAVEVDRMTADGLRHLGGGTADFGGGKMPGMAAPLASFTASADPIGSIVAGVTKVYGEASGRSTIGGAAEPTADGIAAQPKVAAREQGWIPVA